MGQSVLDELRRLLAPGVVSRVSRVSQARLFDEAMRQVGCRKWGATVVSKQGLVGGLRPFA